jgi:N-acetylglucosamine malate deacetylase 1
LNETNHLLSNKTLKKSKEHPVLLVVASHPDDEVLGCGATARLMVDRGWKAHLVVMTQGVVGRTTGSALAEENAKAQEKLKSEMEQASAVLGFSTTSQLDFPDNRMDTVSRMDLSHSLKAVIEEYRPNFVLTHHPGDYNWDHSLTFDAVMMACRCNAGDFFPTEIRTFEVLSSTERAWQEPSRVFCPNAYVDVSSTIDAKKQALNHYASERHPYPHPRSPEAIEYLARKRGNEVGLEYAEAFHIVRKVER